MSKGDFGYGAVREYRDDPGSRRDYRDSVPPPRGGPQTGVGDRLLTELFEKISSNIFRINNNATVLERALKQIGTAKDSVQLRDKIHDTQQNSNRVIGETTRCFKQASTVSKQHIERQQKLQIERLRGEFEETLKRYSSLQKRVTEKVRSTVSLSKPTTTPMGDLVSWEENEDDKRRLVEEDNRRAQLMQQQEDIENDVALIQEREDRIRQLEGDILDINEIFRDLGALVYEQGEAIDTIEANVEKAYDNVESGNEQLVQASIYQKKSRKKMCCLAAILFVVAGVVTLIIVLSVKH
ncbi:unnamed protein product [Owenia fusiformis]|uniref:Uncharacterized protein n=1 Tax=Owenia fusiformis TaxID=6347 RepID=A0A8J1U1N0_OWEFU|nr:unnamed protein product [Owenia fusiformis]